jgi:hypothetical protein
MSGVFNLIVPISCNYRVWVTLEVIVICTISFVSIIYILLTDDFLAERGSPLPYKKSDNVIGTLNEYLQKQGESPAVIEVTPHSQTRFFYVLFFCQNMLCTTRPVIVQMNKIVLSVFHACWLKLVEKKSL